MKYFIVEGVLNAEEIEENLMKEHIEYTQKRMEEGLVLLSSLKTDKSGGLFIMKSDSMESLNAYLNNEPFKREGIQDYKIIEFTPHFVNEKAKAWF